MRYPTISPHDPNVVLVGCDMTGSYITYDGGKSWRMFNLGTGVSAFGFDPSNPDVIYAGTRVLLAHSVPRPSFGHRDLALDSSDPRSWPGSNRKANISRT